MKTIFFLQSPRIPVTVYNYNSLAKLYLHLCDSQLALHLIIRSQQNAGMCPIRMEYIYTYTHTHAHTHTHHTHAHTCMHTHTHTHTRTYTHAHTHTHTHTHTRTHPICAILLLYIISACKPCRVFKAVFYLPPPFFSLIYHLKSRYFNYYYYYYPV